MIGDIILIALIFMAVVVVIVVILSGMEYVERPIIEMDCDGLRQHILNGNQNWEFAQSHHDLRCTVDSHQGNQDDTDFTVRDYDVNGDGDGVGNDVVDVDGVERNGGVAGRANP